MRPEPIEGLKNIGPTIARRLKEIGIYTRADLEEVGPVAAYRRVCERHAGTTIPVCYYLYSLEGALRDQHWDAIGADVKRALLDELPARRRVRPARPRDAPPAGRLRRRLGTGRRGIAWPALVDFAARLPGVQQGVCYGTPALYVRKRLLARLREDGRTVAIKIDIADRDVLLVADPAAFFLTDHYRPYPMVVMRLDKAPPAAARELLEQAWQRAASKRLVAAREAEKAPAEET